MLLNRAKVNDIKCMNFRIFSENAMNYMLSEVSPFIPTLLSYKYYSFKEDLVGCSFHCTAHLHGFNYVILQLLYLY